MGKVFVLGETSPNQSKARRCHIQGICFCSDKEAPRVKSNQSVEYLYTKLLKIYLLLLVYLQVLNNNLAILV